MRRFLPISVSPVQMLAGFDRTIGQMAPDEHIEDPALQGRF
jgi:hypothetical protein